MSDVKHAWQYLSDIVMIKVALRWSPGAMSGAVSCLRVVGNRR